MRKEFLAAALLAGLASCRAAPPSVREPPAPAMPATPSWAERTLARMTLWDKAGQLIGVRAFSNPRSPERPRVLDEVRRLKVGSVVVFDSDVKSIPLVVNELQSAAEVPLLVAADLERSLAFRIPRGVVPLPHAMAIGATRSEDEALFAGEVTAREARAVGIHWTFAPVADVNSNPRNPIVNIRSFGEDPEMVGRLSAAFIRGARKGGLLTTAKHFPGHGDTALDSHLGLPTVSAGEERLRRIDLLPFQRDIDAGVDAVMMGHVAVPALDPTLTPASLSPAMSKLLRETMGFRGLVVTDALEMEGARGPSGAEAAVRAIGAGADFLLLPEDPEATLRALVRSIEEGRLSEKRLDVSVLRILEAKERLFLHERRLVDPKAALSEVCRREDVERANAIARKSITFVRNDDGVLPLRAEEPLKVLHITLSSDLKNDQIQGVLEEELSSRRIPSETLSLGPSVSSEAVQRIVERAQECTHVVVSAFVRVRGGKGTVEMSEAHARLISALVASGSPVILVSFGSPYILRQAPEVSAYVCAFSSAESSQRAVIAALFGEYAVDGRMPVTLPGLYPLGYGLKVPRREMSLRMGLKEEAGFRPDGFESLDSLLDEAVREKAFPGGVVAVGRKGVLAHLHAFGRLAYDDGAPTVQEDTLYDLASLTKVIVTTTMAMTLVDSGKLDLKARISDFLPAFRGDGREKVTVFNLLTHSSGLPAWGPLYEEARGKEAFLKRVAAMDLVYEPGTKSVYSDLGVFLLGEILERVAGESLDAFAQGRLLPLLGMKDTLYRPGDELKARIAPTEVDPWRGRLLKGEVHDENAFALGGVAAHAGLFGSAMDVARFAQMMLNGGVYDHHRVVSRAVVELFTTRAGIPDSSRALGWDTPSGESSAGTLFSSRSYGHTGFTGTSLWIDPERGLFVVLLTNRVNPVRSNDSIRRVRAAVADLAVRALKS